MRSRNLSEVSTVQLKDWTFIRVADCTKHLIKVNSYSVDENVMNM